VALPCRTFAHFSSNCKLLLFHSQKLPFQGTTDTCKSYCLPLFVVFCSYLHIYIKQYNTVATTISHAIVQILFFFFSVCYRNVCITLNIINKQSYTLKALLIGQNNSRSPSNCNFQVKSKRISRLNPITHYVGKNTSCIIYSQIF